MTHSTTKHRRLTAAGYMLVKAWMPTGRALGLLADLDQYARDIAAIEATDRPHISEVRKQNARKRK